MGASKNKRQLRQEILAAHPRCIYCGNAATTTDHCPPRSFFSERCWPETYEFPACEPCNSNARLDEQALSVIVRIGLQESRSPSDQKEWEKLVDGVRNNQSGIIAEWRQLGRNEIRAGLRKSFGSQGDDLRQKGWGLLNIGPLTRDILNRFLVKLAKAIYYQHNKQALDGIIYTRVIDTMSPSFTPEYLETILRMAPSSAKLERSRRPLYDQFSYRFNHNAEHRVMYAVVRFSEQLVFQILAISPEMEIALTSAEPNMSELMGMRHDCRWFPNEK